MVVERKRDNRPAKGTFSGGPVAGFFVFPDKKTEKRGIRRKFLGNAVKLGNNTRSLCSDRTLLVVNVSSIDIWDW
jgi:hypothetical protein